MTANRNFSLTLLAFSLTCLQSARGADETPTEVFKAYHEKMFAALSPNELNAFMSASNVAKYSNSSKSDTMMFQQIKLMTPRTVKITGEQIEGDKATVSVEATSEDPISKMMGAAAGKSRTLGKIKMVKESGAWKIDKEEWSTYSGNSQPPVMAPGAGNWCDQASKAAFPQKPAAGNIHGQPFKVVGAEYSSFMKTLTLKETNDMFSDRQVMIQLHVDDANVQGKEFAVNKNSDSFHSPTVQIFWKRVGKENPSQLYSASDGYGMRLQFGTAAKGLLPGYIVLRLPDKTSVEGYFYAKQK